MKKVEWKKKLYLALPRWLHLLPLLPLTGPAHAVVGVKDTYSTGGWGHSIHVKLISWKAMPFIMERILCYVYLYKFY